MVWWEALPPLLKFGHTMELKLRDREMIATVL